MIMTIVVSLLAGQLETLGCGRGVDWRERERERWGGTEREREEGRERGREGEREGGERAKEREGGKERGGEGKRQAGRQRGRERDRQREMEGGRETDRQREKEREREGEGERETGGGRERERGEGEREREGEERESHRLYGVMDVDLKHTWLNEPLTFMVHQPRLYVRHLVPRACFHAVTKLYQVRGAGCVQDHDHCRLSSGWAA